MTEVMSKSETRRSELFSDVAESVASELMKFCELTDQHAGDIGNRLADFLAKHWAGQSIYIPSDFRYKNSARDQEICERMARGNAHELAVEYGISYVRIYQIYARHLAEKRQTRLDAMSAASSSKPAVRRPQTHGMQPHNMFWSGGAHE